MSSEARVQCSCSWRADPDRIIEEDALRREAPMVDKVKRIWLEGAFVDWDAALVHVNTHTLHYGMGAFEGIRAYKRADGTTTIFRLKEHIERLYDSCKLVMIEPRFSREQIFEACVQLMRENKMDEAYLRPLIF